MKTNTGKVSSALAPLARQASAAVLREVAVAQYSHDTFALRLGVSRALVRAWEEGRAHVPLALLASDALSHDARVRIATALIVSESPAILPVDHAERAVVVAALECVREIAAPANDNAHSATVTDLTLYRSVVRLRKACDSLLASLPAEVRRAA